MTNEDFCHGSGSFHSVWTSTFTLRLILRNSLNTAVITLMLRREDPIIRDNLTDKTRDEILQMRSDYEEWLNGDNVTYVEARIESDSESDSTDEEDFGITLMEDMVELERDGYSPFIYKSLKLRMGKLLWPFHKVGHGVHGAKVKFHIVTDGRRTLGSVVHDEISKFSKLKKRRSGYYLQ